VDSSFLDSLYNIDALKYLASVFSEVRIPEQVEREFLSVKNTDRDKRLEYLLFNYERFLWLKKCNTYNNDDILILSSEPGMDQGEVEVIAQTKKLGLEVVDPAGLISGIDEKRGREIAGKHSIPVMGVLKVLAIMHFQGFLKYFDSVTTLRKHRKRFSESIQGNRS